jgi:hypothetical protein
MISRSEGLKQILRLSAFAQFAQIAEAGREELVTTLQRCSLNREHAENIITHWLRSNKWLPAVADIYATAESVDDNTRRPDYSECDECGNTGFWPCFMLTTYISKGARMVGESKLIDEATYTLLRSKVDGITQRVDTAVDYCRCQRGSGIVSARAKQTAVEAEQRAAWEKKHPARVM